MKKKQQILGIVGALAVLLGAFGAHSLKDLLPADKLVTYQTGIRYHFYHVLAMALVIVLYEYRTNKWMHRAFYFFLIGIILFSGSLYLLATREVIGLSHYKWLGPLTPIGGLFFVMGWISITLGAQKK